MTAWYLERDGNRNLMDGFGEYPHYPVWPPRGSLEEGLGFGSAMLNFPEET